MNSSSLEESGIWSWLAFAILAKLKPTLIQLRSAGTYLLPFLAFVALVFYYFETAASDHAHIASLERVAPTILIVTTLVSLIASTLAFVFQARNRHLRTHNLKLAEALRLSQECEHHIQHDLEINKRRLSELEQLLSQSQTKLKETEQRLLCSEAQVELAERVAHDIRSPLSVLHVLSGEMAGLSLEKRDLIKQVSARIEHVASDFLDFSRRVTRALVQPKSERTSEAEPQTGPQAGAQTGLPPIAGECFLASAVETIAAEKRILFEKTKIVVHRNIPRNMAVQIPDAKLRCILSNVLNNSIEASADSATIDIKLFTKPCCAQGSNEQAVIVINDKGEGIPTDTLARIGTRGFSRGKSSRVCGSGFGLGLYHARRTLETYDASLSIVSEFGRGTTVRIQIPAARNPTAENKLDLECKSSGNGHLPL